MLKRLWDDSRMGPGHDMKHLELVLETPTLSLESLFSPLVPVFLPLWHPVYSLPPASFPLFPLVAQVLKKKTRFK